MIPLFDLHSDTLFELYKTKQGIKSNDLAISLDKASIFSPYIQVLSVWSESRLNDEDAYNQYKAILKYAKEQNIKFAKSASHLKQQAFVLAVEDARILNNTISRIYELYDDGVRILTMNWKWATSIGGGWNTDFPLTSFGKDVVKECINLGIIPDISHSSYIAASQIIDICEQNGKPLLASHSNSFSICNHPRNLQNDLFRRLVESKSAVGISLVPQHLSCKISCKIDDILRHIDYYLELGGENCLCLGCDFDGTTFLPMEINDISNLDKLFFRLRDYYGAHLARKIFFENAYNFFVKNVAERS